MGGRSPRPRRRRAACAGRTWRAVATRPDSDRPSGCRPSGTWPGTDRDRRRGRWVSGRRPAGPWTGLGWTCSAERPLRSGSSLRYHAHSAGCRSRERTVERATSGFEAGAGRGARAGEDLDAGHLGGVQERAAGRAPDVGEAGAGKDRQGVRGSGGVDADGELGRWTPCTAYQQKDPDEARTETGAHGVSETGNARRFHRRRATAFFTTEDTEHTEREGEGILTTTIATGAKGRLYRASISSLSLL
jgi:hypothetical protein